METDPDNWLTDNINENFAQLHRIGEVLYDGRSAFQEVRVLRSPVFGIALVLDGKIQSTELDEHIYHEGLVQPAMITHPRPESVFIAGGGEGATLREALRHNTVKKAVMVDIDAEVIALSKQYLPTESDGAFDDPRTELLNVDARQYLAKTGERFDVIIIDLPDPIEEGPAYRLYTREFYEIVNNRLTADGIISVQAGSAGLTELLNLTAVAKTLSSIFPVVSVCQVHMPCFGGPWGFALASRTQDPAALTPEEVDKRIAQRNLAGLRFYDGVTHRGMFALPKYVREALDEQDRLITDDKPLYLYSG